VVSAGWDDIPGEQLLHAGNRMVGEWGEHVAWVAFGVEAVEFRGADQAVKGGGALATFMGAGEKIILPVMKMLS